jgi:serine/threonine protein kinase
MLSTVDKVRSRFTNEIYARKRIHRQHDLRKDKVVIKKFENELQILKRLDHPHLVKVFGSYSDNKYVAFIMKPVATLDLKKYLRTCEGHLNNGERVRFRTYYGCLATAVAYLHENDIRHKDIKPNNILLKNNDIYITDFGTAIEFDEGQSITKGTVKTKTPAYQSPEVARGAKRGRSSDIWSLGVTFFEMTTILR